MYKGPHSTSITSATKHRNWRDNGAKGRAVLRIGARSPGPQLSTGLGKRRPEVSCQRQLKQGSPAKGLGQTHQLSWAAVQQWLIDCQELAASFASSRGKMYHSISQPFGEGKWLRSTTGLPQHADTRACNFPGLWCIHTSTFRSGVHPDLHLHPAMFAIGTLTMGILRSISDG